jgi:hypothetical protein
MPPLFAAVGAALAGVFGATVTVATAVTIGETVILSAVSIGLGFVERALVGKPKIPSLASQQNQQITARQAIAPWPVFYGRSRTGGTITYMSVTGTNGEFLNIVITLAGHQVNSIPHLYFDGVLVPLNGSGDATGTYAGFVHAEFNLGTSGQAAFPGLVAADPTKWTSTCKQSGRAGMYVQLKYSADLFPNSVPNITVDIQGALCFDPRSSTTVYTENPALCLREYLTNASYGLGCASSEINDASVIAAANACDQTVLLKSGGTLSGGGNQRYLCNGGFTTDQKPGDVVSQLLSSMAGYLTQQNGKWNIYAGIWRTPTVTLLDNDLRGPVKLQMLASKSDLCNQVAGSIINPNQAWQPADFPAFMEDSTHGYGSDQWLTQDNGERITLRLELPFTIDSPMAQRLAKIELERTRRQIRGTWPCKISAYQLQPADVVQITRSRYSWVSKTFEVTQAVLSFEPDDQGCALPAVDLALRETDANVYAWDPVTEELVDPAAGTANLPNPAFVGPPSSLSLSTVTTSRADGIKASFIRATWVAPTDQLVLSGGSIICQYRTHGATPWTTADVVPGTIVTCDIDGLSEGTAYDVRIYATNSASASSAVVEVDNFTLARSSSNVVYRPLSNPLTATDAGATDTVSVAAFTMRIGGSDYSISSGSITSLSRKTIYYIYYDDPTIAGGAVSFSASTTKETAIVGFGRFFVGSILTPPASGTDTVGNNDGGSGASNGNTFLLSPTQNLIAPAPGTVTPWQPIGPDSSGLSTNFAAAADGDTSTFVSLPSRVSGVNTLIFGAFPPFSSNWKSLNLKVKSRVNGNGGTVATLDYSLDGGNSFTNVYSTSANRAITVDTVNVLGQAIPLIMVRFTARGSNPDIFEVWLEGQL